MQLNRSILFIFFFCLSVSAWAFEVPSLTGPVVDQASLLSKSAKSQIEEVLYRTKEKNGPQVQIFIVSSLNGEAIEQVAIQVFDKWQLGDKKIDNGILFLIAPVEKKMRIEVGRGLEGNIPDVIAKRIISDTVRPYFKNNEFDIGIAQGVSAILHYAEVSADQKSLEENKQSRSSSSSGNWIAIIFVLLWIALFIFNPTLALALLFRGGGGGGGGSSRGGWSGGGGGSSGGGASGSW